MLVLLSKLAPHLQIAVLIHCHICMSKHTHTHTHVQADVWQYKYELLCAKCTAESRISTSIQVVQLVQQSIWMDDVYYTYACYILGGVWSYIMLSYI